MRRAKLFALVLPALLCLPARAALAQDRPVVLLSDIHFDPLPSGQHCATAEGKAAGSALTDKSFTQWTRDDFRLQGQFALGQDSTYALMESALAAAHNAAPEAPLVIVPGDLLAHGLRGKWRGCVEPSASDDVRFTHFTANAINFVLAELAANFPGAQIVPVFGNNDSDHGDYTQPSPELLRAVLNEWNKVSQGGPASGPFSAHGYYSLTLAAWPKVRVLALDTTLWSFKFDNGAAPAAAATGEDKKPKRLRGRQLGEAELAFMRAALAGARHRHEEAVVLGHIPPGLDAFATRAAGGKHIVSFYNDCGELGAKAGCRDYASLAPAVWKQYADTIAVAIFGHTHMNEFRVVGESGKKRIPLNIVPSVSPFFGNNPAFQIAEVTPDFHWQNLATWTMPLSEGVREWKPEFDFDAAYGEKIWNAPSLDHVVQAMKRNNQERAQFFGWMTSGNPAVAVPPRWQDAYICGLDHLTAASVMPCIAESQLDLPLP